MHRAASALVAFSLALASSTADVAHARCAAPRLTVELVTPLTSPLPVGGHLVVAIRSGFRSDGPQVSRDLDGEVTITGLSLTQGTETIALRSERIGGGFARLVPARALTAGRYTIVGFTRTTETGAVEQTPRELVVGGELPPAPAAIALTAARATRRSDGETRFGERFSYTSTFRLERALPAGLAAVGIASTSGWVVIAPRTGASELGASGSFGGTHCGDGHVPGVVRPERGVAVHLVLVDVYGRVATSDRRVTVQ